MCSSAALTSLDRSGTPVLLCDDVRLVFGCHRVRRESWSRRFLVSFRIETPLEHLFLTRR